MPSVPLHVAGVPPEFRMDQSTLRKLPAFVKTSLNVYQPEVARHFVS
jgi:hypothetical protein